VQVRPLGTPPSNERVCPRPASEDIAAPTSTTCRMDLILARKTHRAGGAGRPSTGRSWPAWLSTRAMRPADGPSFRPKAGAGESAAATGLPAEGRERVLGAAGSHPAGWLPSRTAVGALAASTPGARPASTRLQAPDQCGRTRHGPTLSAGGRQPARQRLQVMVTAPGPSPTWRPWQHGAREAPFRLFMNRDASWWKRAKSGA